MFQGFLNQIQTTFRLLRDPRVPVWQKAIPVLAVLYVISPFDFVPDLVPGLGQLDDIGIILAAMRLFETMAPEKIVNEHKRQVVRGQAKR
jgi:uncharacterized membrane protein YkvA (DUF1232 family)